jgi:HEAT repeat protein
MHLNRFLCVLALLGPLPLTPFRSGAQERLESAERTLRAGGFATDTPALLEFFRLRSLKEGDQKKLEELVRQLGDRSYVRREKATYELILRGPLALPYLRGALKGAPLEVFRRLEQCIRKIEGIGPEHPVAAARVLASRSEAAAIPVLFAYVPFADDDWAREEVLSCLGRLTVREGKLDPALSAALKDASPQRRSLAVYILARRAGADERATVRKMLADADPQVQLYAAQGLVGKRAYQILRDTADADEALLKSHAVATDEAGLLAFFRKRTLTDEGQARLKKWLRQLGDRSYAQRADASKKLVELGVPALPFLKDAVRDRDLEVSWRAQRCVEEIRRGPGPALPSAAVRLLARLPRHLSAAPALQALLSYVPFADDDSVVEETLQGLCLLSVRETALDPLIPAAVQDPLPARRAAAAFVLGRVGNAGHCLAARKLLGDPDANVRFRSALGLLTAGDKQAVPALIISLLSEKDQARVWAVEEALHRIAGEEGPALPDNASAEERAKAVKAWERWWRNQGTAVDLARVFEAEQHRGLITVCEYDSMVGRPGGQAYELARGANPRWKITGLQGGMDAQVLPNGRVLIAENSARRVSERDPISGAVKWQYDLQSNPIACQRLPNGNTFIATYNQVLEVTPANRVVYNHNRGPGFFIFSAQKLNNGHILCMTAQGKIIELDAQSGKELRTINVIANGGWCSVEALPSGRFLVATMSTGQVREIDASGKTYNQINFQGAFRATRLPNGHTLVASMTSRKVAEFDRSGRMRWERACEGRPWSIRFR